ncbi:MAG: PD-(D/E)XK nuclease family protein [Longimicrobiales bacterium]|nr:PD-(D/E)XK nuclease family protein [Longimicrobiales bacterium]
MLPYGSRVKAGVAGHDRWLGWDRPVLPLAARRLVEAGSEGGVCDLRRSAVVVPGGRAGRRLQELLVEEAGMRHVRLVPPRIVRAGDLPELLYRSDRRVADPAARRVAWIQALRALPAHQRERLFPRAPAADRLDAWDGLAREIESLAREVAGGGHTFGEVARRCRDHLRRERSGEEMRWRALGTLQEEYARRLEEGGVADRDLARLGALAAGAIRTEWEIWLVALADLTPLAVRMLEHVAERVRPLVHAPESTADRFGAFGQIRPEGWAEVHLDLPEEALSFVDGPAEGAAEVARRLAEEASRYATHEISIGAPDRSILPHLREVLGAFGIEIRDAAGRPIESTSPWEVLRSIAALLESRRFEPFAALVRNPDLGDAIDRALPPGSVRGAGGWLGALDRWYAEHLPATLPRRGGRPAGARRSGEEGHIGDGDLVAKLIALVDTSLLGPLLEAPGVQPLSAWREPVLDVLRRIYGETELRSDRRSERLRARVLDEIAGAVRTLDSLPEALDERCTASAAVTFVLDQLRGRSVPVATRDDAIEVLGWLEMHPDDAPFKILTGVNEPFIPEGVSAGGFLSNELRRLLGLPDDEARRARDLYRLQAIGQAEGKVVVVSARRTAAGDPLRPSSLLFAADPRCVAERVRRFHDPAKGVERGEAEEGREAATPPDPVADPPASSFRVPPLRRLPLPSPPERLRVTDFQRILADPYRFALQRHLRAEPIQDDAREMDARLFGTLVHRTLRRFGESEAVHATDPEAIRARLDTILDAIFASLFLSEGERPHVAVSIQREQARARLHHFATWHAGRVDQGWEVVGVESSAGSAGIPFVVDGVTARIVGSIDRIERDRESGAYAVLDYKTSARAVTPEAAHRKGDAWVDLQLPLYRWMLPRLVDAEGRPLHPDAGESPIRVGYVNLPRDLGTVGEAIAGWDDADFDEAIAVARQAIRGLRHDGAVWDPARAPRYGDDAVERVLGRGVMVGFDTPTEDDA